MSETIGQQLRAARETAQLSIEDVAHKTRVHRDVLTQLEADDYSKFANLMFVKGFVKIYSEFVGIDASHAIAQLNAAATQHGEQYLLGGVHPDVRDRFGSLSHRVPVRPLLASAAVIVALIAAGSYLVNHLYADHDGSGSAVLSSDQPDVDALIPMPDVVPNDEQFSAGEPVNQPIDSLIPTTLPSIPESTDTVEPNIPRGTPVIRKALPPNEEELEDSSEPTEPQPPSEPLEVSFEPVDDSSDEE